MLINKYIKSLIIRTIISVILLCTFVNFSNVKNIFSVHFNFVKIMNFSSKLLPLSMKKYGEVTVFDNKIYDNVIYKNSINKVINYSFNGVTCLTDGIIINIQTNKENYYDVYVMDKNDFLYIYKNLKSIDFNIYSYIENGTIIGESKFDDDKDAYSFELEIIRNGEYYDYYELAEN